MFFVKKRSPRDVLSSLGITLHRRNVILGLATGTLFLLSILTAGSFFHSFWFDQSALIALLTRWNFSGNLVGGLIVILMLVNPILEEVYWRGYMHQKLAGKHKPGTVIIVTALFYSLYHLLSVVPLFAWPYHFMMVLPVLLAGVIWGYMRHKQHSLVGSVISHILADVGIMGIYLLFLS